MASTEPKVNWRDKYAREQKAMAASTKSDLERKGKGRFCRALGLLADRLTTSKGDAVKTRSDVVQCWYSCLKQDFAPPDTVFRDEVGLPVFRQLCLYTGANVKLSDLLYKPVETGVWQVFIKYAGQLGEVVIPFGVRRSLIPWVLSNHDVLNSQLKRPLQTYLAVPSRQGAPEVLLLPLADHQEGEDNAEE